MQKRYLFDGWVDLDKCYLTFRDRWIALKLQKRFSIGQHGARGVGKQRVVVRHQKRYVTNLLRGQVGGTGAHVAVQVVGALQVQPSGNKSDAL